MNIIEQYWEIITTPACWIRVGKTCKRWDRHLNSLIDLAESEDLKVELPYEMYDCYHDFKIGSIEIWVNNYPYSFGGRADDNDTLPSRKTVFRLKRLLDEQYLKKAQNGTK